MRTSRVLAVVALVLALAPTATRAQVPGSTLFAGNLVVQVTGCGKITDVVSVNLVVASNGTWSARTSDGLVLSGTNTLVGSNGRKLAFLFDRPSFLGFASWLIANGVRLCGRTVTLVSMTQKAFALQLNQARTKATFKLSYQFKAAGIATGQRNSGKYKLSGDGPWSPTFPDDGSAR